MGQISSGFTVIIPKTNVYLKKAVLVKCRKNKKQKKNCQKKPKRILNGTTKLKKCQDKTYVRKKKQFWRLMGTVPCSLCTVLVNTTFYNIFYHLCVSTFKFTRFLSHSLLISFLQNGLFLHWLM